MRKKYRYIESSFGKYILETYIDGVCQEVIIFFGDGLFDKIEELRKDGYTYWCAKREILEAKKSYEYRLQNAVGVKDE